MSAGKATKQKPWGAPLPMDIKFDNLLTTWLLVKKSVIQLHMNLISIFHIDSALEELFLPLPF